MKVLEVNKKILDTLRTLTKRENPEEHLHDIEILVIYQPHSPHSHF